MTSHELHQFIVTWFQWIMFPISQVGMYYVGKMKTWAWLISLSVQGLWAAWGLALDQPGSLMGTTLYSGMYLWNFYNWRRRDRGLPMRRGPIQTIKDRRASRRA